MRELGYNFFFSSEKVPSRCFLQFTCKQQSVSCVSLFVMTSSLLRLHPARVLWYSCETTAYITKELTNILFSSCASIVAAVEYKCKFILKSILMKMFARWKFEIYPAVGEKKHNFVPRLIHASTTSDNSNRLQYTHNYRNIISNTFECVARRKTLTEKYSVHDRALYGLVVTRTRRRSAKCKIKFIDQVLEHFPALSRTEDLCDTHSGRHFRSSQLKFGLYRYRTEVASCEFHKLFFVTKSRYFFCSFSLQIREQREEGEKTLKIEPSC